MKTVPFYFWLVAAAPLALSGCSSTGDVVWGQQAGGGAGQMAQAGAASGATVRTGSVSPLLVDATVTIIAQHEATMRQRDVAKKRGLAWIGEGAQPSSLPAKTPLRALSSAKPSPTPARHHARYIAVDTDPDSRTVPQARKSVMIFDTEAGQVVGNNVYDIQSPPPVGAIARFETYSAQYIGPGL